MDLHSSTTKCLLNSVLRVASQRQKISRAKRNSKFKRRSRCPLDPRDSSSTSERLKSITSF